MTETAIPVILYPGGQINHDIPVEQCTPRLIATVEYILGNDRLDPVLLGRILRFPRATGMLRRHRPLNMPEKWPEVQFVLSHALLPHEYQHAKDLIRTVSLEWFFTVIGDTDTETDSDGSL